MRVVRAAGWGALAIALLAAALPQLPLRPTFLEASLDGSFAAVLHHTAAQPAAERPRLISTYGPLGYAFYPLYLPETYWSMFAVCSALAAILCGGLAWIGCAAWRSPWGGAVVLLASACLLTMADARALVLAALLPLVQLVPGRSPPALLRLALGAGLGLLALSKVTFVTAGVVVLAPLTVAALLARSVPLAALAAVGVIAAVWAWCGYGWADWASYLAWSLRDITPGYSAAMQLRTAPALVAHAAAVSAALLVWATGLARRARGRAWWAPSLAYAGLLLLQFKAGFVRADVHVFLTIAALLVEAVVLAVVLGRRPVPALVAGLLVAALPGALLWHARRANPPPTVPFQLASPAQLLERAAALPAVLRDAPFAPMHARRLRDLRGMLALPSFEGGVDLLGHWQSLLLAGGAPYRPRPVFQGYMAYTPRLARENAAFLAGDTAPRWLLFHPETIDGRLPSLDDAAAWPVLLADYRAAGEVGRYALLERRATARPWHLVPLGGAVSHSDAAIAVPPPVGGPIWARVTAEQTWQERLTTVVFAAPYEYVDIVYASHAVLRGRLVPAVAADGFLLSPVVTTVPAFLALSRDGPQALPDQTVREIRVHVESAFGRPTPPRAVRVEFFRLEIEPD